jgi:hypothetical protein
LPGNWLLVLILAQDFVVYMLFMLVPWFVFLGFVVNLAEIPGQKNLAETT